ncbi:class B sortase [uncultured Ruminococcus sp.]|uniref:class B sortase n=1 Tax=uncultured Ruminococcus sp. TaxID=165186 RepID=UPI00266569B5|nr:class B sortase [uncultured Ruminococcus sp.]
MKNKEKIGLGVVTTVFSIILIACLISVFSQLYTENKEKEEFRQLADIVKEETTETENIRKPNILKVGNFDVENRSEQPMYYTTDYQPHSISELTSMNSGCFGWISITGTNINYPVMHTPDNPQKYLNRNFDGEYSISGVPFLDGRCTSTSTNLIIYGHHMNNGTMFAELCNYTNTSYRDEHKAVVLETKDGVSAYTVFSVLKVKSDDEWYRFTSALTENRYNSMVEYAKEKSIYETGIAPKYDQQILTLSTCYGNNQNDRILVLAVRNQGGKNGTV